MIARLTKSQYLLQSIRCWWNDPVLHLEFAFYTSVRGCFCKVKSKATQRGLKISKAIVKCNNTTTKTLSFVNRKACLFYNPLSSNFALVSLNYNCSFKQAFSSDIGIEMSNIIDWQKLFILLLRAAKSKILALVVHFAWKMSTSRKLSIFLSKDKAFSALWNVVFYFNNCCENGGWMVDVKKKERGCWLVLEGVVLEDFQGALHTHGTYFHPHGNLMAKGVGR